MRLHCIAVVLLCLHQEVVAQTTRVAQILSPCTWNQSNAERLVLWSKWRNSHTSRQQRGKSDNDWGKTPSLGVRFLWLQQAVQEGRVKMLSVPTSENLSDTFTKSLFELTQIDAIGV